MASRHDSGDDRGFSVLSLVTVLTYTNAPPIPARVTDAGGTTLFDRQAILHGQDVFLKYGLMEHGSLWGHGAYLGPDYSAEYLHRLAEICGETSAAGTTLKTNRYDAATETLAFSPCEARPSRSRAASGSSISADRRPRPGSASMFIKDPAEVKDLTAYFAWAAWATVANRPGKDYSYTNNWPYEPLVGNRPSSSTYLWSALSLITLLGGIGAILFFFGKFDYLGWGGEKTAAHFHDSALAGLEADPQPVGHREVLRRGGRAVPAAEPRRRRARALPGRAGGVLRLRSRVAPSLQPAAHLAPAARDLLDRDGLGGRRPLPGAAGGPRGAEGPDASARTSCSALWSSWFSAACSASGWASTTSWATSGSGSAIRARSTSTSGGSGRCCSRPALVLWLFLMFRALRPAMKAPGRSELASLFLYSAAAIPIFYLPALFYGPHTNFAVIDNWRFWIIHLWVEGFFELFATVLVATMFHQMGLVSVTTATRVVYLDAILYLGGGHHRHRASLVLHRPGHPEHGPRLRLLGHGGGAPDPAHPRRLGLRAHQGPPLRRLRQSASRAARSGPSTS